MQVSRAVAEEKRIVFTGHSSGGSIATLAAIWFLEKCTRQGSVNQGHPFCVTFGSPLIGDNIFNHAVRREGWSQCILNFVLPLDIVPRIPLTPLASFREEIQTVLDRLSQQAPIHLPVGRSLAIPEYYETLLRSTLSIASYEACSFMGCTSSILGTLTSFIELSPYRPCGTYLFLTSSEQLIVLTNSDAVLQLFFYCLQLDPQQQLLDAAASSLTSHWQYEPIKQGMQDMVCVDYLGTISSALPGRSNRTAIGSIELAFQDEDTGSYLSKGRPRRYKYTQKWHEQLQRIPFGSSLESCFWAIVEELQAEMTNGRSLEDLRDRVTKLESDAHGWLTSGSLGKDVLLSSSSFVVWWKTLPEQHRSTSCILKLMPQ
ncbi:hypothetical protein PR202_gb22722 [Eleusine coracana subsp. coracana]|uniref:Uncharacterized protein n=1 Tax=Eleusine coracana subsp. coracana TaxID=191504 RepID=A0AAV5FH45_ELECO|nr:hypothetical protein PR202_gb22722 [Eleusine coracana subsp. coracana]